MTEDRDPFLQTLFAEGQGPLPGDDFVDAVMVRTLRLKRTLYALFGALVTGFFAIAWIADWPLLGLASTLSAVLGMELVSFGDSAVGWLLLPINNLATILVLIWRLCLMAWNRATSASYVS
jgi:hypothetical protein